MIKGKPCKVLSISVSKTGKHGHAKCHFTAVDIFTGKKCEMLESSTHNCDQLLVESRHDLRVASVSDSKAPAHRLALLNPED